MIYREGSAITFTLEPRDRLAVFRDDEMGDTWTEPVIGWAVTMRDSDHDDELSTEIRPVVLADGMVSLTLTDYLLTSKRARFVGYR